MRVSTDPTIASASPSEKALFWSKVVKGDDCWIFSGRVNVYGYGRHAVKRRICQAHRIAKIWDSGVPLPGAYACHLCRNKTCVRPSHLYWGDAKTNGADKVKDGTSRTKKTTEALQQRCILNEIKVREIWEKLRQPHVSSTDVAKEYGVDKSTILGIMSGRAWSAVTKLLPPRGLARHDQGYVKGVCHPWTKLQPCQVQQIRRLSREGNNAIKLAAMFGVSQTAVLSIVNKMTWKHLPEDETASMPGGNEQDRLD